MKSNRVLIAIVVVATVLATTIAATQIQLPLLQQEVVAAYNAVDSADNELFGLANGQGEQFKPLQDTIDSARDALRNNDAAKALQQLDTAEVELLKITQQLPPGEEEGEEG
jgi:hypothetical protein